MIRAVLFDFGGVLTEGGKADSVRQTIAKVYGVNPEKLDIKDIHQQLRNGLITADDYFATLNNRYPQYGTITKEDFIAAADLYTPAAAVYELAERLRRAGIRTGILSNVYAMTAELLREHGLYDNFDPVVLSFEEQVSKPDKKIYLAAIAKLGLPATEVLFIDDQETGVAAAKELGIATIHALSPEQIVSDTEQLIEQINGVRL